MYISVNISNWNSYLTTLIKNNLLYAPYSIDGNYDFKLIADNPDEIKYNTAKTLTPIKDFFFLLKERVTEIPKEKKVIIIGAKACDLKGLELLDKVFLDPDFPDIYYKNRRENTLIIGTDCYEIEDSCHCNIYGINPYPEERCDLILNLIKDKVVIQSLNNKGEEFIEQLKKHTKVEDADKSVIHEIDNRRAEIKQRLQRQNSGIPDAESTKELIEASIDKRDEIWKRYAQKCVSCGACVLSCATCHCFILLDVPDSKIMAKIRSQDACQYPGFEKVAAGVDPLEKHFVRFRNRYICKFINRPEKYESIACTGCGRCIDTCIGRIDKNEVIKELAQ